MKKKETKTEAASTEETLKTKRATRTRKKAEAKPAEEVQAAAAPAEVKEAEKPAEVPAEKTTRKRTTKKVAKKAEEPVTEKAEEAKVETPEAPKAEMPAEEPKAEKKPEEPKAEKKPEEPKAEKPAEEPKKEEPKKEEPKKEEPRQTAPEQKPAPTKQSAQAKQPAPAPKPAPKPVTVPNMSNVQVRDFCDLVNLGNRIPVLNDQQIQMLSWEEAQRRSEILERVLCAVLNYDIVLSDTNIWLELLVGHSSSHSDPRVNARLQFERQLESISKMMKRIGGRFMVMSETYEEIDRFATALEPVNYKDADWSDEALCRNVAARLAKRLMLAQQKENRLRIEGIGSESHHSAFADPAIIRRTVELFASGKKVLLLTNDASVGIRSLGMCDDLQRVNEIDDQTWRKVYEPQRPMVLTMDDLKTLDTYTRQYHYLCSAAGRPWMQDAQQREAVVLEQPLELWMEGFRPGDRHERRSDRIEQQRKEQQRKEQERKEQERKEQERKEAERKEQERREQQRREQQRRDQERAEARRKAEQEAAEQKAAAEQKPAEQKAAESQPAPAAEPQPAAATQPAAEPVATEATAEEAAAPEEKKSRSRRGGRGRRGGKKSNGEAAQ